MNTLLKDLPEHKERIENNYLMKSGIKNLLTYDLDIVSKDGFKNLNLIQGDSLHEIAGITNIESISNQIFGLITDFVNENYEWKGIKA